MNKKQMIRFCNILCYLEVDIDQCRESLEFILDKEISDMAWNEVMGDYAEILADKTSIEYGGTKVIW